jgi:hypothetical protein
MLSEPIIAEALVHREQVDPNLAEKIAAGTGQSHGLHLTTR